ncbi:MAG: hypothetical protein JW827_05490 [Spirochaetes bacterium]|nr:hypothetical protein [Spirochaetota bacterium]
MYKPIIYILLVLLFFLSCATENKFEEKVTSIKTDKEVITYGGEEDDYGKSILKISSDRYMVVGSTKAKGSWSDVWVLLINRQRDTLMSKTFGGPHIDWGESICSMDNHFFYIIGTTYSFGKGNGDIYIIKIDQEGHKIWEKTYGGREWDGAECSLAVKDGILICGWSSSTGKGRQDLYILKIDENGNRLWDHTFGTGHDDYATGICEVPDGYIVIGSISLSPKNKDLWILKIDKNGNRLWDKNYGEENDDTGQDIISVSGGYLIAGSKNLKGQNKDIWIMKINSLGEIIWEKTYGGLKDDIPKRILKADGHYLVAGYSEDINTKKKNIFVLTLDESGNKKDDFTWGPTGDDEAEDMVPIEDNLFLITGATVSPDNGKKDLLFLKFFWKK